MELFSDILWSMSKVWFKAKRYPPERTRSVRAGGYGWYPVTWQGWLVLGMAIAGYVSVFTNIDAASHSVSDTLIGIVVPFLGITALLLFVCIITGEKPRWRWGEK
jgi:hypothetical protein